MLLTCIPVYRCKFTAKSRWRLFLMSRDVTCSHRSMWCQCDVTVWPNCIKFDICDDSTLGREISFYPNPTRPYWDGCFFCRQDSYPASVLMTIFNKNPTRFYCFCWFLFHFLFLFVGKIRIIIIHQFWYPGFTQTGPGCSFNEHFFSTRCKALIQIWLAEKKEKKTGDLISLDRCQNIVIWTDVKTANFGSIKLNAFGWRL